MTIATATKQSIATADAIVCNAVVDEQHVPALGKLESEQRVVGMVVEVAHVEQKQTATARTPKLALDREARKRAQV